MREESCEGFVNNDIPQCDINTYEWVMILRKSIIGFSAVCLLLNIILIIKSTSDVT